MNTNNRKYKHLTASDEISPPGSTSGQMDPASLQSVKDFQAVSKDSTLDHSTKQKQVFEIIKRTPNVQQFLECIQREKGKKGKNRKNAEENYFHSLLLVLLFV